MKSARHNQVLLRDSLSGQTRFSQDFPALLTPWPTTFFRGIHGVYGKFKFPSAIKEAAAVLPEVKGSGLRKFLSGNVNPKFAQVGIPVGLQGRNE